MKTPSPQLPSPGLSTLLWFTMALTAFAQSPQLAAELASKSSRSVIVPAYFYPAGENLAYWEQLRKSAPQVSIAVATGLGLTETNANPDYKAQITATRNAGIAMLAYVTTSGGAKPLADVEREIDNAYNWYDVDGIFFDESVAYPVTCDQVGYYTSLNNYVKAKGGRAITVLNHGQILPECYAPVSDIMLNAETTYDFYKQGWYLWGWETNYPPEKFWHIVHSTDSMEKMLEIVELTKKRNAAYVFITSATSTNTGGPFGSLPPNPYWAETLAAVVTTTNRPDAIVLTWTNSDSSLQTASVVTGAYTNLPAAISPYTNSLSNTQQFFRLINP